MRIEPLDDSNQPAALAYLRRLPYRNAMLLSNVTQLRRHCDVVVAHGSDDVVGVASHYRSLPFLNLIFAVEYGDLVPPLLAAMGEAVAALRERTIVGVMPELRAIQLAPHVQIETLTTELQLVVEPETLRDRRGEGVRRLRADDLPAMAELARLGPLTAFTDDLLDHGPAFGAFADGRLVAMAGTHFATAEVIEIGHVVTHPDYRRRGFAAQVTSAVVRACFALAPRVYLMVVADNAPAVATYRALGFQPLERFAIVEYRLMQ
jgi:ribosomal protein S18 acetylase RimI-like enzyme